MGGCLCHGYITHVLWLWNDVPFPPFTAVFLLIRGAYRFWSTLQYRFFTCWSQVSVLRSP